MTRESQFNKHLTDWLEDQPDRAPSQLLETVLTDLQSAPQSARWRQVLRRLPMLNSNGARYLAVGAVGVLVLVVGIGLWTNRGDVGVPATPTPTRDATESASTTPSPMATATPAPTREATESASTTPSPSLEARTYPPTGTGLDSVLGWPGNRGSSEPGLYSWDGSTCEPTNCLMGVLHRHRNTDTAGKDVRISIGEISEPTISDASATPVTVAGHPGLYLRINSELEEWNVDFDGTLMSISLSAESGASQADVDEANSIIESLVYEQRDTPLGFRLVFRLPSRHWDSPL